jgi:sortase A
LASVSALALWFTFHAFVLSPIQERGTQSRLYGEFREQLANATAPLGGAIKAGTPVALLDGKITGLRDLVVVEGTTAEQLTKGPGHLRDTPLPGQVGEAVIFGRSVTYGAPFRSITKLRPGDPITVTTAQGIFTYRVDRLRRPGDPPPRPFPGDSSRLTLVTSASSGWKSGWAPDHAVYLEASLVGSRAQPAPSGRPTTRGESSEPMKGDTTVLVPVLWLVGLALVTGGFVWAWKRWGRWQTWLTGLPMLIAVLWGASGAGVRFLPNLI